MHINFNVRFRSQHGQSIGLLLNQHSFIDQLELIEIPLHYHTESYWHIAINTDDFNLKEELVYSYIYRNSNNGEEKEFCRNTHLNIKKIDVKSLNITDEWSEELLFDEVFQSKHFITVLNNVTEKVKVTDTKKPTHVFKVKSPMLGQGKVLCLTGSSKKLNKWNTEKPLLMEYKKNHWQLRLNLSKEHFPIEYKLGVYDVISRQITFERGDNRLLPLALAKDNLSILHHTIDIAQHHWKAAGVNIPVSSLKSGNSWGVGDFTDLNLLTDISKATGIKLIQLLPINDTTCTHTNKDSYPYSAVSAFALHPIYLNVQKLATSLAVQFNEDMLQQIKELNQKDSLQYQEVLAIKNSCIRQLYQKDKQLFKDDFGWFGYFDLNRHWLVPYAAYCYLRDKTKTADYNTWGEYESYDEEQIQELVSPDNEFYDEVAIHYFIQYHLHLQLKNAVDYAHKSGIIIKGDLPIGVGRYSADAWMYRSLFHMDMQAGAPPDAFATKGQNWSFPTYNWETMAKDDYAWWRQRMEHMSNYFDAIRIDHVLGFFRIWSIPAHAIEGILGRFVPAWPLSQDNFSNAGFHFNEDRLCTPYITEQLLHNWFAEKAATVKEIFLYNYSFKEELNSQRKIAAFIKENPVYADLQQGLFDLMSNVIAFKDEAIPFNYHLRIIMHTTDSYKTLPWQEQQALSLLYDEYFFNKQNVLWEEEGIKKLAALKRSTNMLICAEDLGMVPKMVESVLRNMQMLALEVQRMPKRENEEFSNPTNAPYASVVTPSTHDMPAIREWWEIDKTTIQKFYNKQLGHFGEAPFFAEPWLCRDILQQHLNSPAMWAVFLLQDLLSMDDSLRIDNPREERINNPADPDHYWNYRMHISLEHILDQPGFILTLKNMIQDSGR